MDARLINYFKVAIREENTINPFDVNSVAIKAGYIIPEVLCNESTLAFANSAKVNYNATFYKCWEDIIVRNETTLLIDQLLHYTTTYGFDYNSPVGVYIPNSTPIEIPYDSYTIIKEVSESELYSMCMEVISNNVALSSDALDAICSYVCSYIKENNIELHVDYIENKEAQAIICSRLGIYPKEDKFALLRCIVYSCTGSSLLIKDYNTIFKIMKQGSFDLGVLDESQIVLLSSIFYRFKPLFLALRKQSDINAKIVNRIRRLATKNHTPFTAGFWETVLQSNDYKKTKEVAERVGELTNFKLVQLIQAIRERLISSNINAPQLYRIRNGKFFYKSQNFPMLDNRIYYWETLMEIFVEQLVENLKKKACTVKFPENLVLTCPSSEKNFVGGIPFGSYFNMEDKNYIGIYWRNEWGTHDFDLSAIRENGEKVGWNSYYKTDGLIYSGDMTDADPEAAELLQCNKTCEDSIIYVNRYNGSAGSKFELMYGSLNELIDRDIRNCDDMQKNCMICPDDIKMREMLTSESRQQMIGAILNNKMYIMDLKFGDSYVSNRNYNNSVIQALKKKMLCYMDLKTLLLAAGFKERKKDTKANPIKLDLSKLNKFDLIKLFS